LSLYFVSHLGTILLFPPGMYEQNKTETV